MQTTVNDIRQQFPILKSQIRGQRFCYLDSAASAQKPKAVINRMTEVMEHSYANVHRGSYLFAEVATADYEKARQSVANFIGADHDEIVFTNGATFGFNLLAHSFGRHFLKRGDKILLSVMEHHANMVPWHILRDEMGVEVLYAQLDDDGNLDMDDVYRLLPEVKLVSITQCSNVVATITPIKEICARARELNIPTIVDGAQSICHQQIDVKDLGCDFFIFSGHKLYGPTGVGVLYGRAEWLEKLPPFFGGGDMIKTVAFDKTTFAPPPARFEAGTPPIIEIIGLGAAIDWLTTLPLPELYAHEKKLVAIMHQRLKKYPMVTLLAEPKDFGSLVAFFIKGAHPHDLATLLDQSGVAIRAGHHCAMPLHTLLAAKKKTVRWRPRPGLVLAFTAARMISNNFLMGLTRR